MKERSEIQRLAIAGSALCVLLSTFSVDMDGPHAHRKMLWGILVTGISLFVGAVLGMETARRGIRKMLEAMEDGAQEQGPKGDRHQAVKPEGRDR